MLRSQKIDLTMNLSAPTRFAAVCLTLFSLLFMQLAISAYACPVVPRAITYLLSNASMHMPCHQVDQDQPTLCHAQASDVTSKLSLDKADLPDVQAFVPLRMAQTIDLADDVTLAAHQPTRAGIADSHAPPTTILHCCFRI